MIETFTNADLDSAERLALVITREMYVSGDIDIAEFERRVHVITGVAGPDERRRVLEAGEEDHMDVTCFGSPAAMRLSTAWRWPE